VAKAVSLEEAQAPSANSPAAWRPPRNAAQQARRMVVANNLKSRRQAGQRVPTSRNQRERSVKN